MNNLYKILPFHQKFRNHYRHRTSFVLHMARMLDCMLDSPQPVVARTGPYFDRNLSLRRSPLRHNRHQNGHNDLKHNIFNVLLFIYRSPTITI